MLTGQKLKHLPVNSLVIALFCRRAEQIRRSQGGKNSWWLARSSAMVLGEPGDDLCSPSPSWQPSSIESTKRNRDCWGGFALRRGRRTHLWKEQKQKGHWLWLKISLVYKHCWETACINTEYNVGRGRQETRISRLFCTRWTKTTFKTPQRILTSVIRTNTAFSNSKSNN